MNDFMTSKWIKMHILILAHYFRGTLSVCSPFTILLVKKIETKSLDKKRVIAKLLMFC
jgi:hypothetical protein